MRTGGARGGRHTRQSPLWWVATAAMVVIFLFPVYWMFSVSLKSPEEIFHYPPVWAPTTLQFNNFLVLFRDGDG